MLPGWFCLLVKLVAPAETRSYACIRHLCLCSDANAHCSLHGVFVVDWLFVFPLCGFSLSLFCNYTAAKLFLRVSIGPIGLIVRVSSLLCSSAMPGVWSFLCVTLFLYAVASPFHCVVTLTAATAIPARAPICATKLAVNISLAIA